MRRSAIFAVSLLVVAMLASGPAAASTITIGCSADELIGAIETANDETATPGGDTIVLQAGCTYTLVAPYGSSSSSFGLPTISSDVTILGNGATIERQDPTGGYGFFAVLPSASLLLSRVTLANGAGYVAGFIANSGDTVIVDSTLTDNQYGNNESAIVNNQSGALAILNSTMTHHVLPLGGAGAAVQNKGDLVVSGSTFSSNSVLNILGGPVVQVGGAISNIGTASIYQSTFTGNHAGAVGGAISNSAVLNVFDSSFVGNSANFGGAIDNSSDLVVQRSYFEANSAVISGGAVYNASESLAQVVNSTFFNNRASTGGAIANAFSLRLDQTTFSSNTATGGAGASLYGTGGLMVVESSIFNGSGSHCAGPLNDFGDNVIYPSLGSCPSTFVVADPKLLTPALRGGPTKTIAFGAGSAAVDRVVGCPTVDQRGFPRPAGPKCDSGAFEDQLPTAPGAPAVSAGGNPNRGMFTLGWSAASDPDGVGVTYRLYHADANDEDFSQIGGVISATAYSFTSFAPEAEGTFLYRVEATDGNHSTPSAVSAAVVVDRTAPTAPIATPDRPVDYAAPPSLGWYRDTVTVTFGGSTDPVLADGSTGSGVAAVTAPQTFSTSGVHVATGSATDHAGNVSATTSLTVQVDAEAPTVTFTSCPADVLLKSATSAVWSASDPSSGLATPAAGSFALDTATIGTRSVTASATDNVGHTTALACTYRVIFDFTGFLRPLVNPPAYNVWTAGDNAAVSFSLAGDQGLGIIAPAYPQSVQIACGTDPLETTGTPTSTTNRGLLYAPGGDGRYTYIWRTDASWAGTCRQLIVKLIDGTYHRANFAF